MSSPLHVWQVTYPSYKCEGVLHYWVYLGTYIGTYLPASIGSPTTRDSAIGSPTTHDSAIGSPTTRDSAMGSRVKWGQVTL